MIQLGSGLHVDRLVQKRRNSSGLAMELHLSCTDPSLYLLSLQYKSCKHEYMQPFCWKRKFVDQIMLNLYANHGSIFVIDYIE